MTLTEGPGLQSAGVEAGERQAWLTQCWKLPLTQRTQEHLNSAGPSVPESQGRRPLVATGPVAVQQLRESPVAFQNKRRHLTLKHGQHKIRSDSLINNGLGMWNLKVAFLYKSIYHSEQRKTNSLPSISRDVVLTLLT